MYKIVTVEDVVRIPPNRFGEELESAMISELENTLSGRVDKEIGIILAITEVIKIGEGMVIRGDGAIYYNATFTVLSYQPQIQEVVDGDVTEITEFGAFVTFGPIDGLIHVSQITEDFMSYDDKGGVLTGKESKKVLKVGDKVRARVVSISLKDRVSDSKIGLTMRQPYLGKIEWLQEATKKPAETKKPRKEGKSEKK